MKASYCLVAVMASKPTKELLRQVLVPVEARVCPFV
jgi:hypothetical protein